ncbi:hypothetical protein HWV62_9823 [Athelia sp. TMB]|nr:hypothetical protein HWV62_9823 [Athelia sp. TMB]
MQKWTRWRQQQENTLSINQAATSRTFTPLLKELNKRTGYVGALILAAPDPARGGELSTISLFIGKTPYRMDWGQYYTRDLWGKHVEDPLIEFASLIYPPEKRKDFRLPGASIHVPAAEDDTYVNSQGPSRATSMARASHSISSAPSGPSTRSASRKTSIPARNTHIEELETFASDEDSSSAEGNTNHADQFDDKVDSDPPWERDELLTKKQLSEIMSEKSDYGRNRAYNIIRNERAMAALGVQVLAREVVAERPKETTVRANTTSPTSRSPTPSVVSPSVPSAFLSHAPDDLEGNLGTNSQREDSSEPQSYSCPLSHSGNPDVPTSPQRPDSPTVPTSPQRPESPTVPASPQRPDTPVVSQTPPSGKGSKAQTRLHASLLTLRPSLANSHETRSRWPGWMGEIVRAMEEVAPASEELSGAMEAWVEFEDMMEYPDTLAKKNVLSSERRPNDVHAWVKAHRKPKAMPDVTDRVDAFAKEWREWWDGLQPMTAQPQSLDARDVAEYSELQKAGRNGIFLLLVSLVWWGGAVSDGGEEKMGAWRESVEEFAAVVRFFNSHLKTASGRKRGRASSEISSNAAKRTRKR